MKKNILPDNFFARVRPHVNKKEKDEDMIPFKWSKEVIDGKKKAILSLKNK